MQKVDENAGPMTTVADVRKRSNYLTIDHLVDLIDEPNRIGCSKLLAENRELFQHVQGSSHNHQAWEGGYLDHVTEVMNIGRVLYFLLSSLRPLPFSLSDILLATFLHDVEKPWKYEISSTGELVHKPDMQTKAQHQAFRMQKLIEYKIQLTPEQENALKYAEGEISDYSNKERKMAPLAALAHMCDVASARLWFDYPTANADPWKGALS
jgi:hypothetical protein